MLWYFQMAGKEWLHDAESHDNARGAWYRLMESPEQASTRREADRNRHKAQHAESRERSERERAADDERQAQVYIRATTFTSPCNSADSSGRNQSVHVRETSESSRTASAFKSDCNCGIERGRPHERAGVCALSLLTYTVLYSDSSIASMISGPLRIGWSSCDVVGHASGAWT